MNAEESASESYRKLLKDAANEKKLGPVRILLPGLAGIGVLIVAFMEQQVPLVLMAALLLYISWQQWSRYRLALRFFKSLEYITSQLNPDNMEQVHQD